MGARYLTCYTENENNSKKNRIGQERERGVSTETEREVAGFIHAKVRGYAQTDTIPYRPGRRSSWSPTPGEHDTVHTQKSPTRLKTRTIGRMRLAPLAFKT